MNCGGCIIECLKINWILVGKINVLLPLFVDDSKSIFKTPKTLSHGILIVFVCLAE